MTTLKQKLIKQFPQILQQESLSKHSTFKTGGPADFFITIKKLEELQEITQLCNQEKIPIIIIGKGSNILFDDKGFRGLVIKIGSDKISLNKDKTITAEAGASISKLILFAKKHGFHELQKWIGLPGTVGGAVRGNAGCNGLETKEILISAQILNTKTIKTEAYTNKELDFTYRDSKIKADQNLIVLSATFQLKKSKLSQEEQKKTMLETAKNRIKTQPRGLSAGSFFKNPSPDKPAGMLIEQAGLKGKQIGGAKISEKHANFIINTGTATSKDILELAKLAKKEVKTKFKINLEEEVKIIPASK